MLHGACHSTTFKEKYSKEFKNMNREKEVQTMFDEVMTQNMEQAKKKRKRQQGRRPSRRSKKNQSTQAG